jgi:DNA ligase D-like protein (predicted 3'-phosphoesterase)
MKRQRPRFVVQKHAARRLHYDFRLEAEGVFKSWAVPKGPSTDPRVKRLAVEVEDHSLSYGDFEGVLAEGQYGAGAVLVWDAGTYENLTEAEGERIPMERALANGHAAFRLEGEKLRGGYTLTRFGRPADRHWLLVKMPDEDADAQDNLLTARPESVLSGRTIEQVAAEEGQSE